MPFSWQARITVHSAGTVSSRSSILILTSLPMISVHPQSDVQGARPRPVRGQLLGRRRDLVAEAPLALDDGLLLHARLEVLAEMLQVALHGHGGGVREHADGAAAHVLADVAEELDVALAALAGVE